MPRAARFPIGLTAHFVLTRQWVYNYMFKNFKLEFIFILNSFSFNSTLYCEVDLRTRIDARKDNRLL